MESLQNKHSEDINGLKKPPRIPPIEKPRSLKLKMIYWYTRRLFGKIITPMKVQYARFPEGLGLSKEIIKTQDKFTLEPKLKYVIKVYVATINGCAFCMDIGKAQARGEKIDAEVFDQLLRFEESNRFTDAEKAALRYIEEATRSKQVSDAVFGQLEKHFSEREIIQITMLNAIENFYNLMNAPLNIQSDEFCRS